MTTTENSLIERLYQATFGPKPIVRLEAIRIAAPLTLLGFMLARIVHPEDWLATTGFRLPDLGGNDWRQPATFEGLAPWAAYAVCIGIVVTALATAAGAFTRWSAGILCVLLGYVALADRLSAFTMSKIGPVIALALALSPAGARWSVDAWRARRKDPTWVPPTHVSGGSVSFFQVMIPVFYFSSGLCKATNDWLKDPYVLWSHLHDSYQTPVSWFLANHMPKFSWTVIQAITLIYEIAAPLWFALPWTRPFALAWGISMHALIGMMFGPVAWFGLLMLSILIANYLPAHWLDPTVPVPERRRRGVAT